MTKLILLNKKKRRKKLHEKISFLFNHLEIENFSLLYIYIYICITRKICRLTNGSSSSWRRAREGRGYYRCMKSFHFSGVSRDVLCRGYVTRLQNSTAYPRCGFFPRQTADKGGGQGEGAQEGGPKYCQL